MTTITFRCPSIKCGKLLWCDPSMLPSNTIGYPAVGIRAYLTGAPFSIHGW